LIVELSSAQQIRYGGFLFRHQAADCTAGAVP
jgi:hypothetical protein